METTPAPKNRQPVKRVPQHLIVIRTSKRKYRIASRVRNGDGYEHWNRQPWGLTNIREYQFVSQPLTHNELHDALAEYCETEVTLDYMEITR